VVVSADVMEKGGMMDMERLVLKGLEGRMGDWLAFSGGVGDKKRKYGNDSPDFNEENETMRYVFLFAMGRVLIRKKRRRKVWDLALWDGWCHFLLGLFCRLKR
jgi:hypothetical protein